MKSQEKGKVRVCGEREEEEKRKGKEASGTISLGLLIYTEGKDIIEIPKILFLFNYRILHSSLLIKIRTRILQTKEKG